MINQSIEEIRRSFHLRLSAANTPEELEQLRIDILGRKGSLQELMSALKTLSLEEKKIFGPLLNQLKQDLTSAFQEKLQQFEQIEKQKSVKKSFDVTSYLPHHMTGSLHPLTLIRQELEDIFISMGFAIVEGPEAETDYYNFQALNIPEEHPARDMWDTFWLNVPSMLMRTHTSPVQIHVMEERMPPFAVITPGRCYRHEATDASHDFAFMQLEGVIIDKNISMGNLLAVIKEVLQAFFKKDDAHIRVRPSYFPFVEPGIEIDLECPFCKTGCSVCKQSRWIESCGAGLIHPHVLKQSGINPEKYTGCAFGFGLTRLAMLKYGIYDIRLLHTNKIEFLEQFH